MPTNVEARMNRLDGIAQALTGIAVDENNAPMVGQLCGALHTLRDATVLCPYPSQVGSDYVSDILEPTIAALAENALPPVEWLANLPLNSALHRIANFADRLARAQRPSDGDRIAYWNSEAIERAYDFVNELKHEVFGTSGQDEISRLDTAIEALSLEVSHAARVWPKGRKT